METHNWEDPVSDRLTDTQLLHELEPVAERLLNRTQPELIEMTVDDIMQAPVVAAAIPQTLGDD